MTNICEIPKYRKQRPGEVVEVPEIGIDGLFISGRGLPVCEWEDGTVTLRIDRAGWERLGKIAFIELVLSDKKQFTPREVRFIRTKMGLTQEEFGTRIGVTRGMVNKYEAGKEPVTVTMTAAIRWVSMSEMKEMVNSFEPEFRKLNEKRIHHIQSRLTAQDDAGFRLRERVRVRLRPEKVGAASS